MMFREGKPAGPTSQSECEHFIRCPVCGKMLDMRELGDVLDHLHGQEIEEEPTAH
ncbi:hypothetical protein IVB41_10505 [Bradyrhizobium sp. 44]|uniref:hypothetical protein n=1 Tax=Bradyrhizobium sp. 44 TaxID=2782675 RepID=UPI001FFA7231|nr:hypothetical protein [Bradyrhizobium sp. 44]MCK1284347.1 hypothetical protein [Bradyrhizobium sp. 44]